MFPKRPAIATTAVCCALVLGAGGCARNQDPAGSSNAAAATASPGASGSTGAAGRLDTEKLTAAEIEKQSQDAMASLSSVRISGNMVAAGKKMTLDLATDTKGNCQGTIGVVGMGQIEIIHTDGTSYLRPDAAFWKTIAAGKGDAHAGDVAAEMFKGRYLTGAKDDPSLAGLAAMCDIVKSMTDNKDTDDDAVKGAAATVNGHSTFTVVSTDDDGSTNTGYVATDGKPYLVKIAHYGAEPGEMNFTDFDKPLTVQAPPADNVIDYTQFKAKLTTI
ncbi:hypothetical protein [Kitasatospora sp. MBT63]|uniref:hypothetical protein n=1 Tax=Kitasatospora sp. MBT63 TaxID=1444768 RepID=UPI00053BB4F4|nr:hypothetical protein [Kitasatospora sp. MBT63]